MITEEAVTKEAVTAEAVTDEAVTEEQALSADDIRAIIAERDRLKANHEKLLSETKIAKQKAKEAEEKRLNDERKRAEEEGNHQKLWESERQRAERLEAELAEKEKMLEAWEQRQVELMRDNETTTIVSELTTDSKRQKALKKLVRDHVQIVDGDKQYLVDGVTLDKQRLMKYIREEYPSLVDGTGMTGGGALGSGTSGGAAKDKGAEAKAKGDLHGFLQAQLK